jgi:hypothetical protein
MPTKMQEASSNQVIIEERGSGFLASCGCGWSEMRSTQAKAELSAEGHVEQGAFWSVSCSCGWSVPIVANETAASQMCAGHKGAMSHIGPDESLSCGSTPTVTRTECTG